MQIKWLEDFVVLSETLSFTKAAELRHVTHPAFGRRIKALEDWAGAALVDRSAYPTRLTDAGKEFLQTAQEVVAQLREARQATVSAATHRPGSIKIATGRTLGRTLFPRWFMQMQDKLRQALHVDLWTGSLHDAMLRLDQGLTDLVFCYGHPSLGIALDSERFEFQVVGHERIVGVCAPGIKGAPRFPLPGSAKAPLPVLELAPSLAIARLVDAWIKAQDPAIHIETVSRADFAEPLQALAREGKGIVWLPLALVHDDLSAGRLVRLSAASEDLVCEIRLYAPRESRTALAQQIWSAQHDLLR